MPKMSFKCKECGEKIVVKEPGVCKCEECGSIYKAFFEVKKKSKKSLITSPMTEAKESKNNSDMMRFYGGTVS